MFHDKPKHDPNALERWEHWPLAALFLTNALNVFLLYVPLAEMPPAVVTWLPWVRVACGIAAAASLEGTLIAVTMGRRLGRDSIWSWATMLSASVFTAAVAYYVHYEVGIAAAILFMAQAVVLFIYSQHLAQPRKSLHSTVLTAQDDGDGTKAVILEDPLHRSVSGFQCRKCGMPNFQTLADVRRHQLLDCLSGAKQPDSEEIQMNGHEV